MDRRKFLKGIGAASAGLMLSGYESSLYAARTGKGKGRRGKSSGVRPNILWIISEDTSPDFRCYGNELVETPNLDKFASQGIRFTKAYAACPVCSPSRSAFCTGMWQISIGAHNHRSHRQDGYTLPEPVKVITEYFRQAGYYTCNSGGTDFKRKGKTDWNFNVDKAFDGIDWRDRKPGQPFYAQVNLHLTHRVFVRDKERPIDESKVKVPPIYPDHPVSRRDRANYLESIQVLDRQVGKVLKRLEEDGLADNTIVFYFGDHGYPQVWAKQWLYEGGIHVPLMVRIPEKLRKRLGISGDEGQVRDDLVSLIDVGPTSLWLAGIEVPSHIQGKVFLGRNRQKRDYVFAARDRCDETVERIRCVSDGRYKYIRNYYPDRPYTQFNAYKKTYYPVLTLLEVFNEQGKLNPAQAKFMGKGKPREELYDLQADPFETKNLAEDNKYDKIRKRLSSVLDAWISQCNDAGAKPESEKTVNYWKQVAQKRYKSNMKKRGFSVPVSNVEYLKWWEKRLFGKGR